MGAPADEAKRRAEGLVSDWHKRFRLYIGGGSGLDHQARTSLVMEIAAAIAGPLAEIERLKEDAAPARPARRAKED